MSRQLDQEPWQRVIAELQERGIAFDEGLSDAEVNRVEYRFGFRFPLTCGRSFKWACRAASSSRIGGTATKKHSQEWLDVPRRGILFDIQHNDFWLAEWGPRPSDLAEAFGVASTLLATAPKLIPICNHRMMPDEPRKGSNPVFSVHQTDIIYYGYDLLSYLRREFKVAHWWTAPSEPRTIRFWNLDRFSEVRWKAGSCVFDNSRGTLPKGPSES